jgi:hypothetical protein
MNNSMSNLIRKVMRRCPRIPVINISRICSARYAGAGVVGEAEEGDGSADDGWLMGWSMNA